MATFSHAVGTQTYRFDSLKDLMAKASPARSGDFLAGVAAQNDGERVAAQMALADTPLAYFLQEALIPYETDEVTRLTKLNMTGWDYRQMDLPEDIAQFFVSELHPGRFSEAFQHAVSRVVGSSLDPLQPEHLSLLNRLSQTRHCSLSEARTLLPALHRAFGRQHGVVHAAVWGSVWVLRLGTLNVMLRLGI